MNEWKECKLGDIASKIGSGATPTGGEHSYKSAGITLVRSQNVYDFHFDIGGLAFIDEEQANLLSNVSVEENDILMNITGESVTRCCLVPKEYLPARVNQHVSIIRPINKEADYKFVFYYLHSRKLELNSIAEVGCTRRALTKGTIENLSIFLPPLPEQRAIAGVLSSLDDKIDLSHRQNKTLEGTAEAIYRHLFLDGHKAIWKECVINELATHEKASVRPDRKPDTLFDHYSVPTFDESHMPVRELGALIQSNKYIVKPNTILFSKLNPDKDKRVWLIPSSIVENSICSTEFQVINPKDKKYLFFLYGFITHPANYNEIAAGVGGTSSSHQRIDPEVIFRFTCFIPDDGVLANFNKTVEPIFGKIFHNLKSVQVLSHLRDTLLPRLMSGQVKVRI